MVAHSYKHEEFSKLPEYQRIVKEYDKVAYGNDVYELTGKIRDAEKVCEKMRVSHDNKRKERELQQLIHDGGPRKGFFLGDGAGMGKGRTLAGFIAKNYSRGRKNALWISVSKDLMVDAQRDLGDLGMTSIADDAVLINKVPYQALIGKSGNITRLDQIVKWAGKDFDGLIMFDECHKAKNLQIKESGQADRAGAKDPKCSKTGIAVKELQECLPCARIVYCCTTGVSEPRNMAFMSRLGLWGVGTPFNGFPQYLKFLAGIGNGGSEMYAIHLKKSGQMLSRTLAYEGADFQLIEKVMDEKVKVAYEMGSECERLEVSE